MDGAGLPPDEGAWIESLIRSFCEGPENTLQNGVDEPAWADPLVGFSRGDDPLYERYKEVVGPEHWTPCEILQRTFPGTPVEAEELTVIAWVLPQTEATKAENRRETVYPAERWARARIYGEAFNNALRGHVVQELQDGGVQAVAPFLSPHWQSSDSPRYVYTSTWSERHAAFASGLGTFGLCDGLITPRGKAMRVGSVVARIRVPPTPRPYADHRAYCLFFANGTCGECIDRCPVGAISEAGHDKVKCRDHLRRTRTFVGEHYGFEGYGCGLCQTGVPCESGVPVLSGHRQSPSLGARLAGASR
jgi:epoxyqueuosine reductase QueG